jgi:hypothetical protein
VNIEPAMEAALDNQIMAVDSRSDNDAWFKIEVDSHTDTCCVGRRDDCC